MSSWSEVGVGAGGNLYGRLWRPESEVRRCAAIVHGLGEHGGRYEELALRLVAAGFAVLAYDQQGHGESPGRRGCVASYASLLDDLAAAVDMLSERFGAGCEQVLIGHSMGANVAISYALRKPADIDRLILSGALLLPSEPPNRSRILAATLTGRLFSFLRINAPVRFEQLTRDKAEIERMEQDPLRHSKLSLYLATQLLGRGRLALDRAADLEVPTLFLHGEDDPLCDYEACNAFASRAVRGRVAVQTYPGMRHEIFKELGRERVFDDLIAWLEKPL